MLLCLLKSVLSRIFSTNSMTSSLEHKIILKEKMYEKEVSPLHLPSM